MENILIENYRGFDIEFNKDYEKFQCIITEDNTKESLSYSAIKKFIDEYKSDNNNFKPFWIERNFKTGNVNEKRIKIIGKRKDNRFIYENDMGEKQQMRDYYLDDYILVFPENESGRNQLIELEKEEERQRLERNEKRKQILSTMKIITLSELKKTLI